MAKYTLRQYRNAYNRYEQKLAEFVSHKGRTYSSKYYEFQERVQILENKIQNGTYTNGDIYNMMQTLTSRSIYVEHTVQYDPKQDKFVSPATQPVYDKRETDEVPRIKDVKSEAKEEYNKMFGNTYDEDDGEEWHDGGYGGNDDDDEEEPPEWYHELYTILIEWCQRRRPNNRLVTALYFSLLRLNGDHERIAVFESMAKERGLDEIPLDSDQMAEMISIIDRVMNMEILGDDKDSLDDLDDAYYDDSEFGDI